MKKKTLVEQKIEAIDDVVKATKKVRKVKTTGELIKDMHKLEKRILNEIVKSPSRALEIGKLYMEGYSTFTAKQQEAYKRLASVVKAR